MGLGEVTHPERYLKVLDRLGRVPAFLVSEDEMVADARIFRVDLYIKNPLRIAMGFLIFFFIHCGHLYHA